MAAASRDPAPVIRFEAEVVAVGGRRIARLPAAASAELPSRGQVAVVGRIAAATTEPGADPAESAADSGPGPVAGVGFTDVVEPDGRRGHWVDVDRLHGTGGGPADALHTVTIELTPADAWPEPEVPADLRAALDAAPTSAATWADITPMARWEWVRWITSTRSPATRDRRVEVGIDKLDRGSRRPCCFDLSSCTDPDLAKSGKLITA